MKLSDDFFKECRQKTGKSIRYLTDTGNSNIYHKEWKLYAPENILSYLELPEEMECLRDVIDFEMSMEEEEQPF